MSLWCEEGENRPLVPGSCTSVSHHCRTPNYANLNEARRRFGVRDVKGARSEPGQTLFSVSVNSTVSIWIGPSGVRHLVSRVPQSTGVQLLECFVL